MTSPLRIGGEQQAELGLAPLQVQVGKPEADELGYADVIEAKEIGGQRVSRRSLL